MGAMTDDDIGRLAALVRQERRALLETWRAQVKTLPSARGLDIPTLNDHIPGLIEELATALRSGSNEAIAQSVVDGTPPTHGEQRYADGFDIQEVVAEYNILRACIHDLADRDGLRLQGEPFHVLNRVLDGAIGAAVDAFADQQAQQVQQRREEYLSFVAHDLRAPLNAIALTLNYLERAREEGKPPSDDDAMWKILRRNVRQLELLVGKILKENVNIEAEAGFKLEQRVVDLWPLVENVMMDLQPVAESAGASLVNAAPEELLVYADASMTRRVFQNLIANAISHAPSGNVVIAAKVVEGGGWVECSVTDDGDGIPSQRLDAIFEKLESDPGDGRESGLGLGLPIVKAFVEAHGGEVKVDSQPGAGSCFRFTLPAGSP